MLTIAATDSGGAAGIAADLRTFATCGVHGCLAVTAVTVQNTLRVSGVQRIPPETVAAQIEAVASDIRLDAAKTGLLPDAATMRAIVAACDRLGIGTAGAIPLVVDPVAASARGDQIIDDDALQTLRTQLAPRATLCTPNLDEVRLLVGLEVHDRAAQYEAAGRVHALGPRHVLIKGGRLREDVDVSVDVLYDGTDFVEFAGPRFKTPNVHGSGDCLAAAIAAALARGVPMANAVGFGKRYVIEAVRHAYPLGAGHGPVSGLWAIRPWWEWEQLPSP